VLDASLRGGKKPAAKPKKTYGVKPKNPAPAFRPISAQAKPFGVAQARAKKQTTKARAKVPANPKLARVPIKKSYSAPERKAIVVALKKARGTRTNRQLYNDSNQAERHYLAALGKALNKPQTSKAHAGPKQQKHGMKFTGETKLAGVVPVPGLHQLGWTVDQALKNLARPAHAVTSAAYAAQEGRSPLKGASEGFTGKRVKTGSDLLKRHGMKGIPAAILGTAGDIVLDPLNLATGGTGSAAEHLVTQGGRLLHRAAELEAVGRRADAGAMSDKAHRLLEKAKTAPANKGIQVGVKVGRHEVKTSGALTAKLSKRLGISHSATAVRNAPVAQALGHALDPAFRPAGVSAQEWKSYRNRLRESRGEANTGIRTWERRGRAYAKALKKSGHDDAAKQVIDALERARKPATETAAKPGVLPDMPHQASIHRLPEDLKPIAIAARKDLKHIGKAEKQANILERTAQNYVPHQWTRAAQKAEKKAERRGKRNPYAARREDARPISEQHAELPDGVAPTFDTDLARLVALRGGKHEELMANRRLANNVVQDIARPLDKLETSGLPTTSSSPDAGCARSARRSTTTRSSRRRARSSPASASWSCRRRSATPSARASCPAPPAASCCATTTSSCTASRPCSRRSTSRPTTSATSRATCSSRARPTPTRSPCTTGCAWSPAAPTATPARSATSRTPSTRTTSSTSGTASRSRRATC
jgi:hypothetical protein